MGEQLANATKGVRVAIEMDTGRILFLLQNTDGSDTLFALTQEAAEKMAHDVTHLASHWKELAAHQYRTLYDDTEAAE